MHRVSRIYVEFCFLLLVAFFFKVDIFGVQRHMASNIANRFLVVWLSCKIRCVFFSDAVRVEG